MTFTRRSDGTTLTPTLVIGPIRQARETATMARRLAQSGEVRVTYTGSPGSRTGSIGLLFETYEDTVAAVDYFTAASLFEFDGVSESGGTYTIVAGYIVETADATTGAYALVFAVPGGSGGIELSGSDDEGWEVRVPYIEVPE